MEIAVNIHQPEGEAVAVMKLTGDINASNFMEIVSRAQELFGNPAKNLVIDLADVTSVSTTGLVALHKIALLYSGVPQSVDSDDTRPDFTHSSNARKFVKLLAPQPEVDKALEKAGMKLFFKVYEKLADALASFQ